MIINKLKDSTKRASGLIHEINRERVNNRLKEMGIIKNNNIVNDIKSNLPKPKIPDFVAGDAITVSYYSSLANKRKEHFRGVVLSKRNRGYGSSFKVIGSVGNTQVEQNFPLFSPLIDNIEILRKAHIHNGEKRVRRSKIFYLRDRPQSSYRIKNSDTIASLAEIGSKKKTGKKNSTLSNETKDIKNEPKQASNKE